MHGNYRRRIEPLTSPGCAASTVSNTVLIGVGGQTSSWASDHVTVSFSVSRQSAWAYTGSVTAYGHLWYTRVLALTGWNVT